MSERILGPMPEFTVAEWVQIPRRGWSAVITSGGLEGTGVHDPNDLIGQMVRLSWDGHVGEVFIVQGAMTLRGWYSVDRPCRDPFELLVKPPLTWPVRCLLPPLESPALPQSANQHERKPHE